MEQKTVRYQDIDGYKVISGFAVAATDPEATNEASKELILALPELKAINDLKSEIAAQQLICVNLIGLNRPLDKDESAQFTAAQNQIAVLNAQMPALQSAYDEAATQCWLDNQKFFTPGPGEGFISDDDFATLSAKYESLADHTRLCLDGTTVSDNRDRIYWIKGDMWVQTLVATIGQSIPSGAVFDEDLTDAQRAEISAEAESARVARLADAQKLAEAQSAQKSAKMDVVSVQTEVTAGVSSADDLAAAQSNYKAVLAQINLKYGTSLT